MFEFHVSRQSRDRYQFDQSLFSYNGNVIFANFHAASRQRIDPLQRRRAAPHDQDAPGAKDSRTDREKWPGGIAPRIRADVGQASPFRL